MLLSALDLETDRRHRSYVSEGLVQKQGTTAAPSMVRILSCASRHLLLASMVLPEINLVSRQPAKQVTSLKPHVNTTQPSQGRVDCYLLWVSVLLTM